MAVGPYRHAFSVDLEDWFQGLTSTNPRIDAWPVFPSRVVPATRAILSILDRHQVKATFFTLGYVADTFPSLLEEIAAGGHEIGVHGYHHRFVSRMTRDEFAREIDLGTEAVYRVTHAQPQGHRAPYFSVNARTPWAFDVLAERGFRYDSSVFPIRSLLYGFAGARREPHRLANGLIEFPLTTMRLGKMNVPLAGGFYTRVYPYEFLRWALRRVERQGLPIVMYVHPWEIDLDQPRIRTTARERITHFHGRAGLPAKLDRLLTDFDFGPIASLLDGAPA